MKILNKTKSLVLLVFIFVVVLIPILFTTFFTTPTKAYAATSPSLGAAGSYSVLGGTTVTNTGATTMPGDLGVSPGTAVTGSPTVGPPGSIRSTPDATLAQLANTATFLALSAAPNVACDGANYGAITKDLGGLTLTPGVYCADAFQITGTLTLDDTGAADGVWIFRSAATLVTATNAKVQFLNGIGSPCNVWWKEVSSATIGVGTTFIGNILASTSITLQTNATLEGRALAQTGAVTMDTNTITGLSCLTAKVSATSSTSTSGGSASAPAAKVCPALNCVTPIILESRRIDADSIYISWGPYAGISTFIVQYGLENGKWLYNTKVAGFSTTLNALPANQPIWVLVSPTDDCSIGPCGVAKLVGGPLLPNAGIGPQKNSNPWYLPTAIFGISVLLILIQRNTIFSSKHESLS